MSEPRSSVSYILLDTMVASGMYALSQKGELAEFNRVEWQVKIKQLLDNLKTERLRLAVPTPSCYELMCKDNAWRDYLLTSDDEIFRFARLGIKNEVLLKASEYTLRSEAVSLDGSKVKMLTMDPMIAAYSLLYGYYILTENQADYCEPDFSVVGAEALVLKNRNGSLYRRMLYLLKPSTV